MTSATARRTGATIGLGALAMTLAVGVPGCGGGSSGPDAYTRAADRICATATRKLVKLQRRHRQASHRGDPDPLARAMFTIVGDERVRLAALKAPSDRIVQTVELDQALLDFEARLTDLIHLGFVDRSHVLPVAKRADAAGVEAEGVASRLGLEGCAAMPLAVSPSLG